MASRSFTRPENAISKAEEFIKVGKQLNKDDTILLKLKSLFIKLLK